MFLKNIIFVSMIGLTCFALANATLTQIDCKDTQLNDNCVCAFDQDQNLLVMECQNLLDATSSKLPDVKAQTVIVQGSFSSWPVVPASYNYTKAMALSENKLTSIGDLSNLINLKYLNLSYNEIKKIGPSLATLKELVMLDLSMNYLEELHFENFIFSTEKNTLNKDGNDAIFSKLQYLFIYGNLIKTIYNLDLMFIGMFMIN